jgi:hypothetical protein
MEDKQHRKAIGEGFDKIKLLNSKPPSFVVKERIKKKLLMYVDVNITPVK